MQNQCDIHISAYVCARMHSRTCIYTYILVYVFKHMWASLRGLLGSVWGLRPPRKTPNGKTMPPPSMVLLSVVTSAHLLLPRGLYFGCLGLYLVTSRAPFPTGGVPCGVSRAPFRVSAPPQKVPNGKTMTPPPRGFAKWDRKHTVSHFPASLLDVSASICATWRVPSTRLLFCSSRSIRNLRGSILDPRNLPR